MKKLLAFGLAFLGLLVIAFSLEAQCRTVVRPQVAHHNQVYEAYVAPAAIYYAPATVYYQHGYAEDPLRLEVQILQLRVRQLELEKSIITQPQTKPQGPGPIPQANPLPIPQKVGVGLQDHPAIGIMKKNCAVCHDEAVAKVKGKNFVMFTNASLVGFTDKQLLVMTKEVFSGRMPKGSKITDEDVGQIMDWLDNLK